MITNIIFLRSDSPMTSDKPHYENVPFEVPSSWVWTTLGEICIFLSRGKSPKYKDDDRTYPVFAQKCNLKEGGISLEQARFIDPNTIDKWAEEYKLKTGDILINSTGTGTVGRTRLFNESCLGDYPFVVPDSHVSVVRTHDEILSEFIYAYISSNFVQQYLEENLAGSTNQKELYIGILDNLNIPLPPYKEQKRIADEIERWSRQIYKIDDDRDNLTHTIKQVKIRSSTSPFTANSYPKTLRTNLPANCSSASIPRQRLLLITGIIRSCPKDG